MRIRQHAVVFALVMSAFALSAPPTYAVEALTVSPTVKNNITKVDYREHCEHARRECRERHGDREREFHECMERERCGDRDRERCEHVRRECRERHGDRERAFHECLERERCER
jgi:hypothetical protein